MASSKKNDGEKTVRAVLAYAAQLRDRADAALVRDPHAALYRPSSHTARTLSQRLGPDAALTELATRARRAELRVEEAEGFAGQGRERLRGLQLVNVGERAVDRERLSLGQRLDAALLGLGVVSEVSAARLDGDPVSGGKPSSVAPLSRRDRQLEDMRLDVVRAVERLERELDSTRRRLVELEAAA